MEKAGLYTDRELDEYGSRIIIRELSCLPPESTVRAVLDVSILISLAEAKGRWLINIEKSN